MAISDPDFCYYCGVDTRPDFLQTLRNHSNECSLRRRVEECIERGRGTADLDKALSCIDWQQVVQNGGPPCF